MTIENNNSSHNHSKVTAASLLITLGIIYGDIGTSPLYVLKAIIGNQAIDPDTILGGISAIFWTLTMQTTLKYVILTLRADNHGEGGIFALYTLVSKLKSKWLIVPAMIGGAALLADGMITPPISISSAIEGLRILPQFQEINTVPIIIFILGFLFFFQQFGTALVGKFFGPIMFTWFSMLAILGIAHLSTNLEVLKAINPYYTYQLLANHPNGFWLLGAVFLCTTGAEAVYSDLGHCGKDNIRISWGFVKVALLLNYMGQGANLLKHSGEIIPNINPFYALMPDWFLIPGIIISTLAAIVASQALISGSFTLINEAIRLNFWPKVKVMYPTDIRGQLYIPSTNWLLFTGCVAVVLYFRESSNMEAAYGLAIIITMMMTTTLLYFYLKVTNVNKFALFGFLIVYSSIELSFFVANAVKFAHGGWFILLFATALLITMAIWHKARLIKNKYVEFTKLKPFIEIIKDLSNDSTIPKYASNLVYLTGADNPEEIESKIIYSLLQKQPKRSDILWFVHVNVMDEPYRMEYEVKEVLAGKIYRITYNLGFRVEPRINLFFRKAIESMVRNEEISIISKYPSLEKHRIVGDFKFVIFEKYFSFDNEFPLWDKLILKGHDLLKKFSLSEERAFGLDTSSVIIEKIPLVIVPIKGIKLIRLNEDKEEIL